jgi:hypothetical protein
MRVEQAIGAGTDDATTGAYLQEYRERHKIGSDEKVFVTLAHDATSATAEGVWMVCEQERGPSQESQQYPERELSEEPVDLKFCFTFMMLPLNHDLPNLVIRSTPYQNGKIDDFFLTERNHLTQVLTATNFVVLDVATDGDPAMNPAHLQFFERCVGAMEVRRNTTGDLDEVCEMLFTEGVTEIPVSDPYHLFKRCRQRLIHADTGLGLQSCIK